MEIKSIITSNIKICVLLILTLAMNIISGQTLDRKAILIIDIQENLVNPNSKIHIDTSGIDMFFSNLNMSNSKFNNKNDLVIYVVNEWTNPFKNWLTGNVCKKGATGVGLDKRLVLVNDKIFSKSKPNALTNKYLLNYLRDNNISEVYIMGLLAEGCVKSTLKGLKKEKFNVIVIEDALGSKSKTKKTKVLEYLRKNDIKIIKAKEI